MTALALWQSIRNRATSARLRNMTDRFSILPIPKESTEQTAYAITPELHFSVVAMFKTTTERQNMVRKFRQEHPAVIFVVIDTFQLIRTPTADVSYRPGTKTTNKNQKTRENDHDAGKRT